MPHVAIPSLLFPLHARRTARALLLFALPMMLQVANAAERTRPSGRIVIQTDDVTRFFNVLDASGGKPSADDLQRGYLHAGTDALRSFTDSRIGSMDRLADAIQHKPALFAKARTCATALPEIRERVAKALDRLGTLLPSARFPPVTVLVGRGNSGGVTTPDGVVIGLEALCNADWMQADVSDRFVHLIAHEYVHIQQPGAAADVAQPTLLYQTLLEGGAEYVTELISGQPANAHLRRW
ncbi:lytic murein transglycosylase, partial [Stenotrophomonas maltophilia]|nr:lytic murein transglycosylase [Stenotrophomonas maltophilia]